MILRPANGRETRALMRQAREHQKQSEFAETAVADSGAKSELIGDLLQDEEHAEDGTLEQFLKREGVQFSAEEPAEDVDARGGPRGEGGEGALVYSGAFPEAVAEEAGGGRS